MGKSDHKRKRQAQEPEDRHTKANVSNKEFADAQLGESESDLEGGLMETDEYKVRLQQWSESMKEEEAQINQNETVDVDFDFYDLKEDDFLTVKYHWKTLLDADNTLLDLSALSELLISNGVGVCIKSEGEDSEPLALMSALDVSKLHENKDFTALLSYLVEQTESSAPQLYRSLRRLQANAAKSSAALVICERLVNLPWELLPHLYNLFKAELEAKGLLYDKLVILTRGFVFENGEEQGYFHYEDPELLKLADESGFFDYKVSDRAEAARSSFTEQGIVPKLGVIILDGKKLTSTVETLQTWVQSLLSG